MKKIVFITILILSFTFSFSQLDYAEIKGTVTSSNVRETEPVENADIILSINDTIKFRQITDKNGKYSFLIKKFKGKVTINIETTKKTKSLSYKKCGYLSSRDKGIIEDVSKNDVFIKDFFVVPVSDCGRIPEMLFKENSTDNYSDSSIVFIATLLNENPEIVIEVSGHADSKEKAPAELSENRAKVVKEKLIALGINDKRIETRGYGSTQILVNDKIINKAATKDEKKALRQKNRRVTVKILRFDFPR